MVLAVVLCAVHIPEGGWIPGFRPTHVICRAYLRIWAAVWDLGMLVTTQA